jgi:hypothetical protein
MEKKLVLEELYRMRELMGMKVLSESNRKIVRNLLMEGGKTVDELIGLGPKSVDNLTKNGVDFVNDLTKLSDEFNTRGIKTFADLTDAVALSKGVNVTDVTDDMIESYIKNDEKLYQSILAKASAAAADQIDQLVKSANLTTIFSKDPQQLISYKTYISTPPSARNVDLLINSVDDSIDEVEGLIDDIQTGKIPGVNTVPDELQDLYENLLAKKTDLENFKNRGTSPQSTTDEPEFPDPFTSNTDEVVDPKTPIEEVLDRFKNSDMMNKYPGLTDADIKLVSDQMTAKYGKGFTYEQLLSKLDQLRSDFMILMQKIQDEYDELIQQGNEEAAKKKKSQLEGLKKVWGFVSNNKITQFCIGSKSTVKQGQVVNTVSFKPSSFLMTPLCLTGAAIFIDFLSNYQKDPMEKEFVLCPPVNALGLCSSLPEGWCKNTCGGGSSTSNTNTKFKNDQEELDVLLVNIKRQITTLGPNFKLVEVLNRDEDGNATSVSWSDPDANPTTGTMALKGTTWL